MARDEERRKKVMHNEDAEDAASDKKTIGDSDLGEAFEAEDEEANDFSADFDAEENE